MDQHDEMLHTAWADLRGWLDGAEVAQALEQPSVLAGWTVRELIAHLGRAFTTMTGLRPSDEPPLPMLDYVAAYRPVASGIATATRKQAAEIEGDVLLVVDQLVADGLAGLAQTTAEVVQGPRGPIQRADFVITRILEVVVHGDDLQRSVPQAPAIPWQPDAVTALGTALADGYEARTGRRPASVDLPWIRQAAGRSPSDDAALPLL